jgi:ankyrin repeat protein
MNKQIKKRLAASMSCPNFSLVNSPSKKRIQITVDEAPETQQSPAEYALSVFKANGYHAEKVVEDAKAKFRTPTPEMIQAYTMETTEAVRAGDLAKVEELYEQGALLDCCNRFGNRLVHIACRRQHANIVQFLLEEVKVSIHVVDELNRTPLHDACWTSEPNFGIVELLLRFAPEHMLLPDSRGHTPFDYARKAHHEKWIQFLSNRKSMLRPKEAEQQYMTTTAS